MKLKKNLLLVLTFFFLLPPIATGSNAQEKDSIDVNHIVNTLGSRIKLSGYAQAGFCYEDQHSPNNEFKISRIIFMADGKITDHFNCYFMYDFRGNSLHEFYLNYHLSPALNVRMGEFKTPFSIENEISPSVLELISPSSLVTSYMIGGSNSLMMPGSSGRDMGINAYGSLFNKKLDYAVAIMSGQGRNNSDANSQKDYVAKLSIHPVQWLTLSASGIMGTGNTNVTVSSSNPTTYTATAAPGVTGFKSNGNYTRNRLAFGGIVDTRDFSLRSEYMYGKNADNNSNGFYATGCLKNIFTNLDAIASYDNLKTYSDKQQCYTAGIQYWFYPKCRLQAEYSRNTSNDSPNENCILTQIQIRF